MHDRIPKMTKEASGSRKSFGKTIKLKEENVITRMKR